MEKRVQFTYFSFINLYETVHTRNIEFKQVLRYSRSCTRTRTCIYSG